MTIPAQLAGLATNCVEFSKHNGTTEGSSLRAARRDWRSERQEEEEFELGNWNMEVCLSCWDSPIPKRLRRVWQQCFPVGSWQSEESHGRVWT